MSKSLGNIVVPWDVIDRHGADAFRWYFLTSKQPWDGYLFSVDTVGESRAPVPAAALEHVRLLRPLRERQRRRAGSTHPPATDLDRWALSRLAATVEEVTDRLERLRRHPRRPGDRRVRRRALATGTSAARAARFWDGDPAAFATLRACLVGGGASCRAVHPVPGRRDLRQPRRLRGQRAPVRLAGGRRARHGPRVRDGDRARDRPARPGRPRAGEAEGPPAAARRGRGGRRRRARGDRAPAGRRAARSSTSRSCATSRRPTSSAPTRSSPTTARSARASASTCRRSRRPWPRSTPRTWPSALRDGGRVGIAVDGHDHELDADDLLLAMRRWRATSSSARARTRWRSSWSSTTSCSARGSRARSSTPCRTRARPPACRWRTGSSCCSAATGAAGGGPRARALRGRRDARGSRSATTA